MESLPIKINLYKFLGFDVFYHILAYIGLDRGLFHIFWPENYNGWKLNNRPASDRSICSTCGKYTLTYLMSELTYLSVKLYPIYKLDLMANSIYIMSLSNKTSKNVYFRFCTNGCVKYFIKYMVLDGYQIQSDGSESEDELYPFL